MTLTLCPATTRIAARCNLVVERHLGEDAMVLGDDGLYRIRRLPA